MLQSEADSKILVIDVENVGAKGNPDDYPEAVPATED